MKGSNPKREMEDKDCLRALRSNSELFMFKVHPEVPLVLFHRDGLLSAVRPTDPKRHRRFRVAEDLDGPILRPVTGPSLDASTRTGAARGIAHTHLGADGVRISGQTAQDDPESPPGALIRIKLGGRVVLRDSQVHAAVMIEVSQRGAPLFSINFHARDARIHRGESPLPTPAEPQTASAVVAGKVRSSSKKVLAEKQIFHSVPVEIADIDRKHR